MLWQSVMTKTLAIKRLWHMGHFERHKVAASNFFQDVKALQLRSAELALPSLSTFLISFCFPCFAFSL
jgi:hypothetical protein